MENRVIHRAQGSVERANQDIENILACWMTNNETTSSSSSPSSSSNGLKIIDITEVSKDRRILSCSVKNRDFKSLNLPNEVLCPLESEEDLTEILSTINDTHDDVNGELSREDVVHNQNIDSDESLPSPSTSQHNTNHNCLLIHPYRFKMYCSIPVCGSLFHL